MPAQPNQSVIDGIACLQALAGSDEPVAGRDLARELGLEPTRVNRLLGTLRHLGLAEQDERRRYRPGPGIHVLAAQAMYGSGLLRRALPALDLLRDTGLVIALGVLWRDKVAYLYHGQADQPASQAIGRVGLYPASKSGLGLAILTSHTKSELNRLFPDKDERVKVIQSVIEAKAVGYAVAEREDGSRTLGLALTAFPHAALGVSGRIHKRHFASLVDRLREVDQAIVNNAAPAVSSTELMALTPTET